jgi:polyhydroxybutyrate depolymerase
MKRYLLLILFLLPVSCKAQENYIEKSFLHQERERTYYVYLPKDHVQAQSVPLVLALHGGGGKAENVNWLTNRQLTAEADSRDWIVVFPEGVHKGWNDGRVIKTGRDRLRMDVDDVGFLAEVISRMVAEYGVDATRVYATGISNGGFMAMRLAIDVPEKIAAIATVTANLAEVHRHKTPPLATAVLVMNGTDDPLVPYAGGQIKVFGQERGDILSTQETIEWWVRHNGCLPSPKVEKLPDQDTTDGCSVEVATYGNGKLGTEVVLYKVVAGGHTWPGGKQYLGKWLVGRVCRDINATQVIFDFFARHRRVAGRSD